MTDTLRQLRQAAGRTRSWRRRVFDLIHRAHKEGHSMRAIAEAAGMSPSTVHRIGQDGGEPDERLFHRGEYQATKARRGR